MGPVGGGVGRCEPRIEVFLKMQKTTTKAWGPVRGCFGRGCRGCEVIVKMQKKWGFGRRLGRKVGWVDVTKN